ncbi:MAG: hypothetical protein JWN49_376 [Parcubacteria group bacterium]|nr:hypothetical protein [Parcubacteria group bacterium]
MFHGNYLGLYQHKIFASTIEISFLEAPKSFFEALRCSVRDLCEHRCVFVCAHPSQKVCTGENLLLSTYEKNILEMHMKK